MEDKAFLYEHAKHTYHEMLSTLSRAYQHPHAEESAHLARHAEEKLSILETIFPDLVFDFS